MRQNARLIKTLIGINIKKYRELKNMTQEYLSEKIGINTSALSDLERGKTFPKPENLVKIAQALDIPYELLFVNTIINPDSVKEDFDNRIELLKDDFKKFTLVYNYLKTLI